MSRVNVKSSNHCSRSYLNVLPTAARELVEGPLEDQEPVQVDEDEVVDGGAEETHDQPRDGLAAEPPEPPP